jgi:hypothetical protein
VTDDGNPTSCSSSGCQVNTNSEAQIGSTITVTDSNGKSSTAKVTL